MSIIKVLMNKSSVAKLVLSLSVLLMISGCSDNTATDDNASVESVEPTVVEAPTTVESAEEVAVVETPVDESAIVEADTNTAAAPEILAADAGSKLYDSNCKACHANGLLNAPIFGDKAAWETRLTKGKETLYMHSAQGFNKMPAQAVNGITEAQVKASVDYMLAAVS